MMTASRTADDWIDLLDLEPHPEGGFYREIYRSLEMIAQESLAPRYGGDSRDIATCIHFLLHGNERSVFHRLKSDELWMHHAGCAARIWTIDRDGGLNTLVLGSDIERGESLTVAIPAGCWFAVKPADSDSYVLASCVVAPGFDFRDFEIGSRVKLIGLFPAHAALITSLTRPG